MLLLINIDGMELKIIYEDIGVRGGVREFFIKLVLEVIWFLLGIKKNNIVNFIFSFCSFFGR